MKAWISGNFDTDLGAATITKVVVTAPANEDATSIVITLTLSNGTATKDANVTVSPLPSQKSLNTTPTPNPDPVNQNQADVDSVKASLEAITPRITTTHSSNLPTTSNDYSSALAFLTDIGQSSFNTKGTTLTLGSITNNESEGTKSFTITVAKGNANSATTTMIVVSGFKTTVQGAQADVNAVKVDLEAITPKMTAGHKNELPTTNNNYSTVQLLLADVSQPNFNLRGTTLTLGEITNNETEGTKSFTITITKDDATATLNFKVSGFNTTLKLAQANVDAVKASLEAIEIKKTTTHSGTLPSKTTDYTNSTEFLTDINQKDINVNGSTLALTEFKNDDAAGTKTFTITITKSGASATLSFTVTGFQTTAQAAQADVDAVQLELQKLVNKATSMTAAYPTKDNDYSNAEKFLEDIKVTGFEDKGTNLVFSEFVNNVDTGTKSFKITISKDGATTSKTVEISISGFKQADANVKAWYDKWAKRTDWQVKQFRANAQATFTRNTAKAAFDDTSRATVKAKLDFILTTPIEENNTPTTLADYTPVFNVEEITTNADATTLKIEYYLTKTTGTATTYFSADGTEVSDLTEVKKGSLSLSEITSDLAQLQAQAANLMVATQNSGIFGNNQKLSEWMAHFVNNNGPTSVDEINQQIAEGFERLIHNPQTGSSANGTIRKMTLMSQDVEDDVAKIRQFMANPGTKTKLIGDYKSVKVRVFEVELELNETTHKVLLGGLNGRASAANSLNNETLKDWVLTTVRVDDDTYNQLTE
ncbi:lipoprotein-associated protein [Mycoplasma testudineum]|uniref:Lipoprotein-associated protein n=1 Tax=Mycoplasma testudineum TaxID=244584 RepID=A0A4R6IGN6_9MOLU|nr:lipoprotein 17-related variable surface protein [Mycoplasma testudineum]OYD26416.1 hypothetical protein CG473_04085 [Mycoplasma testudineum]TDO21244.1 lipoprotein-associated protein [Mycoplasma testudineum]